MTITSIGSSFSWIAPTSAVRGASAPPEEAERSTTTASGTLDEFEGPQAGGKSKPSVSDEMQAVLVKAQEKSAERATHPEAARAYAGR